MTDREPKASLAARVAPSPGRWLRGRRALLATLVALAGVTGAVLTTGLGAWSRRRRPRERELSEADVYGPHDLAG